MCLRPSLHSTHISHSSRTSSRNPLVILQEPTFDDNQINNNALFAFVCVSIMWNPLQLYTKETWMRNSNGRWTMKLFLINYSSASSGKYRVLKSPSQFKCIHLTTLKNSMLYDPARSRLLDIFATLDRGSSS